MRGILRYNGNNYGRIGEDTYFIQRDHIFTLKVGDLVAYKTVKGGCTYKGIVIKVKGYYTVFGYTSKQLSELYEVTKILNYYRVTKEILNDEHLELVKHVEMTRAEIEEKLGHPFTIVED